MDAGESLKSLISNPGRLRSSGDPIVDPMLCETKESECKVHSDSFMNVGLMRD